MAFFTKDDVDNMVRGAVESMSDGKSLSCSGAAESFGIGRERTGTTTFVEATRKS